MLAMVSLRSTGRPRAFLRPGIVPVTTVSAAFRFEGCPHCVPLRVRQAKLARSSRWKSGPGKGQRPPGSECCVSSAGDGGHEAYTAIVWGGLLSRERYYAAESEAVDIVEGNMCGPAMRGYRSAVVEDPITHKISRLPRLPGPAVTLQSLHRRRGRDET